MPQNYHISVLLHEAILGLNIQKDGTYIDCTYGGGGHTKKILEQLGENGKVLAFDQDNNAEKNTITDSRFTFIHNNFKHLKKFLRLYEIASVQGILVDLGVSSHQIDTADRGFSTKFDLAQLDMRMNAYASKNAQTVLNTYTEKQLANIFFEYGDIPNAKKLAHTLITYGKEWKIQTIGQLKKAIHSCIIGNPNQYFAKVFQAIRIEVNEELACLSSLLEQSKEVLATNGRLCTISFHSAEDRIIKQFINAEKNDFKWVTKTPIGPSLAEQKNNNRSRSAKLRIAEKV